MNARGAMEVPIASVALQYRVIDQLNFCRPSDNCFCDHRNYQSDHPTSNGIGT